VRQNGPKVSSVGIAKFKKGGPEERRTSSTTSSSADSWDSHQTTDNPEPCLVDPRRSVSGIGVSIPEIWEVDNGPAVETGVNTIYAVKVGSRQVEVHPATATLVVSVSIVVKIVVAVVGDGTETVPHCVVRFVGWEAVNVDPPILAERGIIAKAHPALTGVFGLEKNDGHVVFGACIIEPPVHRKRLLRTESEFCLFRSVDARAVNYDEVVVVVPTTTRATGVDTMTSSQDMTWTNEGPCNKTR